MGGTIGADSQLGVGSVFWFSVELAATKGALPSDQAESKYHATLVPVHVGEEPHWHILVAEDNLVNTKVVTRLLTMLGHTAEFAADGVEAVALAGSGEFDLILMDCQMPKMDGLEATQAIRAQESDGRIPIIAVTASALHGERTRCLNAGMDDVLPKPFKKEDLQAMLHHWLIARARQAPLIS